MQTDWSSIQHHAYREREYHPFRWWLCAYLATMAFVFVSVALKPKAAQALSSVLPRFLVDGAFLVLFVAALLVYAHFSVPFVFVWSLRFKRWRTGVSCHVPFPARETGLASGAPAPEPARTESGSEVGRAPLGQTPAP